MNIITTYQNFISAPYLALIILLSLSILIPIWLFLIYKGYKLCNKNNALGVILLFISLNLFGLIWGITILYNASNYYRLQREELYDKLNKYLDKQEKNKPPQP